MEVILPHEIGVKSCSLLNAHAGYHLTNCAVTFSCVRFQRRFTIML